MTFDYDGINVKMQDERYKVSASLGKIQAKTIGFSGVIFIGARESGPIKLKAVIHADELVHPIESELQINFTTEHRKMTFDDLRNLPEETQD